jgi:hypothetical protein
MQSLRLEEENVKFGVLSHSWEEALAGSGRDAQSKNDRHVKLNICRIL